MGLFNISVAKTLQHEGGFVNTIGDSGGATNMGITQADLDRELGPGTKNVKDLTIAEAEAYYEKYFWNPLYSQIQSQDLTDKIFDLGVLFGSGEAVALLQQQLSHLTVDGKFGPSTLTAINAVSSPPVLLSFFKAAVGRHIEIVVAAHPEDERFEAGWEKRVNS